MQGYKNQLFIRARWDHMSQWTKDVITGRVELPSCKDKWAFMTSSRHESSTANNDTYYTSLFLEVIPLK